MRIEQGVKVVEHGNKYDFFIKINEYYIKQTDAGSFIVCQASIENDRKIISVHLNEALENVLKIAKKLNENLKRGDV